MTEMIALSLCSACLSAQGECDSAYGKDFLFTALEAELVVGEIYVRVYNEQPTFVLEVSGRSKGGGADTLELSHPPSLTGPHTVL